MEERGREEEEGRKGRGGSMWRERGRRGREERRVKTLREEEGNVINSSLKMLEQLASL